MVLVLVLGVCVGIEVGVWWEWERGPIEVMGSSGIVM